MTGWTTVEITTADGQTIRLEPANTNHPRGPSMPINSASRSSAVVIDPTTRAIMRGFLAVEA